MRRRPFLALSVAPAAAALAGCPEPGSYEATLGGGSLYVGSVEVARQPFAPNGRILLRVGLRRDAQRRPDALASLAPSGGQEARAEVGPGELDLELRIEQAAGEHRLHVFDDGPAERLPYDVSEAP
jgi:hypothetical protein